MAIKENFTSVLNYNSLCNILEKSIPEGFEEEILNTVASKADFSVMDPEETNIKETAQPVEELYIEKLPKKRVWSLCFLDNKFKKQKLASIGFKTCTKLDKKEIQTKIIQKMLDAKGEKIEVNKSLAFYISPSDKETDYHIFLYNNKNDTKPIGWVTPDEIQEHAVDCSFLTLDNLQSFLKQCPEHVSPKEKDFILSAKSWTDIPSDCLKKYFFCANGKLDKVIGENKKLCLIPQNVIHKDKTLDIIKPKKTINKNVFQKLASSIVTHQSNKKKANVLKILLRKKGAAIGKIKTSSSLITALAERNSPENKIKKIKAFLKRKSAGIRNIFKPSIPTYIKFDGKKIKKHSLAMA